MAKWTSYNISDERVSFQILDLEQQLKKQAGEDKKFVAKDSNPLPQIDGLADEETKEQQAAALASMISQNEGEGEETAHAESGEAPAAVEEPEDVQAELSQVENAPTDEQNSENEVLAEEPAEEAPVVEEEQEAAQTEMSAEEPQVFQSEPDVFSAPAEDDGQVEEASDMTNEDAFYQNLIESVKNNPAAWEKLLKGIPSLFIHSG
jgi:hypothetical protein